MLTTITACLLATSLAAPASTSSLSRPLEGPTDEEVIAAWEKLEPEVQEELVEWFRSEVVWLDTFQNSLVRFCLENQPRDAGLWPIVGPGSWYDPEVHAPAQPIARKRLSLTSKSLEKKREEFFFRVPERKLDSAFIYDYGEQELRRTQRLDDPDRIFRNALAGFPPDLDLAEALVEMWLDDGSQQATAEAFAHLYTDRSGRAYTGLTLYDAWASGANMEMPDVDTLGVIHDLEDDWKSYRAPVPERKHKQLYDQVGALFKDIQHHRGLRHAMAMTYLSGYPALRDGYGANLERFHALWDSTESTPEKLESELPDSEDWDSFLKKWIKTHDKSKKLKEAGITRRDTLHNDGLWVRHTMISVMTRAEVLQSDG
jgi:hypothetical protein